MLNKSPAETIAKILITHFAWFLVGVLILLSLPFLISALTTEGEGMFYHIVRDIGIAFLVAAIVSAVFELHARSRFHIETMRSVLDAVIGEDIGSDIWNEMKSQFIERDMIRRGFNIHLGVTPIDSSPNLMILSIQSEYKIHNLRSRPKSNVNLSHRLDNYIRHGDIPKFEYINIGGHVHQTSEVKDGIFTTVINLEPKDRNPIDANVSRKELKYIPGSYTFFMTELTKGFTLRLTDLPKGIEASVNFSSHPRDDTRLEINSTLEKFKDTILLPGQGIEFRFKREGD
jgi:hypothetical protein